MADTVDDNIFQWNVKMSKFGRDSHLFQDCQELLQKFGYDYIELQLDFSMVNSVRFKKPESSLSLSQDLYPFYPPLVKVIRPRLQGSMMLRVTTMEILKLNGWDFAKNMKSVLIDIKDFLARTARYYCH